MRTCRRRRPLGTSAETRARLEALRRTASDPADRERLKGIEADVVGAEVRWNPAVDVFGRGEARRDARAGRGRGSFASWRCSSASSILVTRLRPSSSNRSTGRTGRSIAVAAVMMTTVGLIVLLACANVANLLLASRRGQKTRDRHSPGAWCEPRPRGSTVADREPPAGKHRRCLRAARGHPGAAVPRGADSGAARVRRVARCVSSTRSSGS